MEYRWHIFLANLDPVVGSEQGRTRPVLVISEEEIMTKNPITISRETVSYTHLTLPTKA